MQSAKPSCFNQQEADLRAANGRRGSRCGGGGGNGTTAEAAVFCLPSERGERERERERLERGNITRFSASDQIPARNFIQLDVIMGVLRIWSGLWRRGGFSFVVETAGMNKKMEEASEGNMILPCLAHVTFALSLSLIFPSSRKRFSHKLCGKRN